MRYFCSLDQIKAVVPFTGRLDDSGDLVRKAVTSDFNKYMRRTFDYEGAHVEYLDTIRRGYREPFNIWPEKIPLDTNVTISLKLSYERDFSTANALVENSDFMWDSSKECIVVYPPTSLTEAGRIMQLTYGGGCLPVQDDTGDTDVLDCDPSLTEAAIEECAYRLQAVVERFSGQDSRIDGKKLIRQRRLREGLLEEVAFKIHKFRRPLGRAL